MFSKELVFEMSYFGGFHWSTNITDPQALRFANKHLDRMASVGIPPEEGSYRVTIRSKWFGMVIFYKIVTISNLSS